MIVLLIFLDIQKKQVSNLIDIIHTTIPYYIFISSTASILGSDRYAKDKKAAEDEIIRRYDNYLIMRPYYLCGKYDYTDRFDYSQWPRVFWKDTDIELSYDDVKLFRTFRQHKPILLVN